MAEPIKSLEVVDPATGQKYSYVAVASLDSSGNVQKDSAGNVAINIVASDTITVRQETEIMAYQENDRITITASTTPVDTWDISWADEVYVTVTRTGSTDTIEITPSYDGSNFETTPVEGRDATAAIVACTGITGGTYAIPHNGKKLRFTASGSTDTFVIAWSARNSSRSVG